MKEGSMHRLIPLLAAAVVASTTLAQETQPTTSATAEQLKATVTAIEGIVQVRSAEDQPWQKAAVGMSVGENGEFRTGPKSAVQFKIPPDQTITLDRLGTVKVLTALNDNGKLKTHLGMRYGRTRYDIEAAGREHESTISSPSSTLAVRGTKVSVFDQRPFTAQAVSLTGRAEFRDLKKRLSFGRAGQGKTVVNTEDPNAAAAALTQTVIDPTDALARSRSESVLVQSLLSTGATVEFDYDRGIRVVRGGKVPRTDAELIPTLPGTLNFVLRWTGNADVNLGVVSPIDPNTPGAQGTVYPLAGFNVNPNGGSIAFDHRGGPNGGMEIASWGANFPEGAYFIGAQHMSGANVPATVDVFLGAQRVPISTSTGDVTTANFIAAPIDPQFNVDGIAVGVARVFRPSASAAGARKPAARQKR
jgi:hypothetical protein